MNRQDMESQVRGFVLDSLIARSGKELTPLITQEIARELVDRVLCIIESHQTTEELIYLLKNQ